MLTFQTLWQYPEDPVTKPSKPSVTPRRIKEVAKQRESPQDASSYEAHTDKVQLHRGVQSYTRRVWLDQGSGCGLIRVVGVA